MSVGRHHAAGYCVQMSGTMQEAVFKNEVLLLNAGPQRPLVRIPV